MVVHLQTHILVGCSVLDLLGHGATSCNLSRGRFILLDGKLIHTLINHFTLSFPIIVRSYQDYLAGAMVVC